MTVAESTTVPHFQSVLDPSFIGSPHSPKILELSNDSIDPLQSHASFLDLPSLSLVRLLLKLVTFVR